MRYFDTHCHFDFPVFEADRADVWARCNAFGLRHLLVPGVAPEQWPVVQQLAQQYGFFYGLGIHPWWLPPWQNNHGDAAVDRFAVILKEAVVANDDQGLVAIGECGMDKSIDLPLVEQEAYLTLQLGIAEQYQLPVILHAHKVHADIQRLLKTHCLARGGVIHGFSGSYEIAKRYWDLGFRLGVGGVITYPRANKTRTAIAKMPLEALVLETDAPDMPLCGRQGQRNSPEYLPLVLEQLAALKQLPLEQVAEQCFRNSEALFMG